MSAALRIVGAEPTLDELASTANREHRHAVKSAQDAVDAMKRSGAALLEARAKCNHGEFLPWLAANFEGSQSTAYNYMWLAEGKSKKKLPTAGNFAASVAEHLVAKVLRPSESNLGDDLLRADLRQAWLWAEDELPLAPRAPAQQREVMARDDGHTYRCPHCATEWSGDPRPALRGALAPLRGPWGLPKRESPLDP